MSGPVCECGKPTAGAVLCDGCAKTFAYALPNVAAYHTDLGTVARKQARYGSGAATKGSVGKSQPLPVDMRFIDGGEAPQDDKSKRPRGATLSPGSQLRWDTWNTVVAWCRTVMEEQPELHGPACAGCLHISCAAVRRRRWPQNTVPSMVNYLSRQFRWIVREDWAPAMFGELLDLERRLARFVDRPGERWYAGKCWVGEGDNVCTAELWARSEGQRHIDCPACNYRHDVASRRDVLLGEAKEYLVTATQAAGALMAWTDYDGTEDKLVDRIRKWRDRERLEVRDVTSLQGKDRHLYRLGDIQDLLVEAAQKAQGRRIGGAA